MFIASKQNFELAPPLGVLCSGRRKISHAKSQRLDFAPPSAIACLGFIKFSPLSLRAESVAPHGQYILTDLHSNSVRR